MNKEHCIIMILWLVNGVVVPYVFTVSSNPRYEGVECM